jgi:hypothetical protein
LGTNTFHNARIEGCGVSVSRRSIAQAYVFCATRYDYRSDVHKKIAEKNPSLTHYVVFDTERFIDALGHLAAHVCPTSAHNYGGNEVTYVDSRESEYTFDELVDTSKESRRFVDAMFRKPRDFAHEEEIRFGFGPERGGPTDPLYVKDMAAHFVHLFKAAIVSCGALGA